MYMQTCMNLCIYKSICMNILMHVWGMLVFCDSLIPIYLVPSMNWHGHLFSSPCLFLLSRLSCHKCSVCWSALVSYCMWFFSWLFDIPTNYPMPSLIHFKSSRSLLFSHVIFSTLFMVMYVMYSRRKFVSRLLTWHLMQGSVFYALM